MPRPRKQNFANEIQSLDEAYAEQQNLFFELDPYLFLADSVVCQRSRGLLFQGKNFTRRPPALVFPPDGGAGWYQGFLSDYYTVSVYVAERDPFVDEVTKRCGAVAVSSPLPTYLDGATALVIHAEVEWHGVDTYLSRLATSWQLVDPEGILISVIPGRIDENHNTVATFLDGTGYTVEELQGMLKFDQDSEVEIVDVPFASADCFSSEDYLTTFLKRHRSYFGKSARGACLARMADPDFRECVQGAGSQLRTAIIVILKSTI